MTDQPAGCRTTQHCAVHDFCHRCMPSLDEATQHLVKAIDAAGITTGTGRVYAALAATVRDAARQTTGQADTEPAPADRRPYRRASEPGPTLVVTTDTHRLDLHQVGWHGQTGAFYALDENPLGDGYERGSVGPLYTPTHADRLDDLEPAPAVGQPAEAQATDRAAAYRDTARRAHRRLAAVERLVSGRPGYHQITVKELLAAMSDETVEDER